ncbi:MAG: DUF3089 domain-containing protein [Polyangiaceae bacterium]
MPMHHGGSVRPMAARAAALFLTVCAFASAACSHPPPPAHPAPPAQLTSAAAGFESAHYADPESWLCLPGRQDACAGNLDATEIGADGSHVVVRDKPAPGAEKVDCFYVYPTVDLRLSAANHEDFDDLGPMTLATVSQAARFRSTCSLYVPLYRQVTIGTYLRRAEVKKRYTDVAFSDVAAAFLHYMARYNRGHRIVLLGHSQGGEMVSLLLKRFFDRDPAMHERLLLAMPIGWAMEVAAGKTTGGTFANVPICTQIAETGCVVGYRAFLGGTTHDAYPSGPSAGHESVCVNPAALAHRGRETLSRAFFPVARRGAASLFFRGVDDVTSPFVLLRDFYSARCVVGPDGDRYLAVSERPRPGDQRQSPVDLWSPLFRTDLGLHILDYQLAQGDLVDLVAERAAVLP